MALPNLLKLRHQRPRASDGIARLKAMIPGSHEFLVHDSEMLIESPILTVRRDQLSMPGGDRGTREVVEHFGAVAIVAIDAAGRIPMVRQYRHSVGTRLWELPAGLLDIAGEEEVVGAQRELQEEAGLHAASWAVLVDLVTSPGFCDEAVRVFLAQDLKEITRPEAEFEEADLTMEWFTLEEAKAMIFSGAVVNGIAIAGIMTASEVAAGRAQARDLDVPFEFRPTALATRRVAAGRGSDMKRING